MLLLMTSLTIAGCATTPEPQYLARGSAKGKPAVKLPAGCSDDLQEVHDHVLELGDNMRAVAHQRAAIIVEANTTIRQGRECQEKQKAGFAKFAKAGARKLK